MNEITSSKTLSPFDIINMMFTNYEEFNKLSDIILEKNYFIINRVFSIKYPLQGALFNNKFINTAKVIRSWALFITNKEGYGKVPYFVYSKGAKKSNESKIKNNKDNIDKSLISEYCKRYHITLKDFNNLKKLYYDDLITDVKRYEKLISLKEQEKNISK
jgi:Ni,Fe-hydrogenase I large subunit